MRGWPEFWLTHRSIYTSNKCNFASPFFPSSQEVRWECFDFGGRWKLPLSKLLLGSDLGVIKLSLSRLLLIDLRWWGGGHLSPGALDTLAGLLGKSVWSLSFDVSRMRPVCPVWPCISICPKQKLDQAGLPRFISSESLVLQSNSLSGFLE